MRGFWAAWGGWALDGMDSFIYALVLVPALRELLPRSGIAADSGEHRLLRRRAVRDFSDRLGLRVPLGTGGRPFRTRAHAGAHHPLLLAVHVSGLRRRRVSGNWRCSVFWRASGIGGEWTLGGVFVAEEWPESRRKQGAAWMHTGYYFGTFLAAIVNYAVGARYGWRAVFAVGGTPALLVAFIRYGVQRAGALEAAHCQGDDRGRQAAFFALFSPEYRRRTIVNAALLLVSMVGLWAGSVYVPSSVTLPGDARRLRRRRRRARMASYAHDAAFARHDSGLPAAALAGRRDSDGAARWGSTSR